MHNPPLFSSVLPRFAAEVASALAREYPGLASQVDGLRIGSFCGCTDPACMTFDVPGRRRRDYSFSIELEELDGLVIVDVAEHGRVRSALAVSRPRIIGIEALERPDLRRQVDTNPEVGRTRGLPLQGWIPVESGKRRWLSRIARALAPVEPATGHREDRRSRARTNPLNDCEEADVPGPLIPPSSPEEALAGKQLTPRMLRVLAAAADEAERRGHSFVGTEHTLLGLLSEPDGIAGVVLRRLGAADAAATETRKIMDSEGYNRPQSTRDS